MLSNNILNIFYCINLFLLINSSRINQRFLKFSFYFLIFSFFIIVNKTYAIDINISTSQTNIIAQTQSSGEISQNSIKVTGTPNIQGWVTTGVSYGTANIFNNTVDISGGTFNSFISGAYATNGNAFNNIVTVTGGSFNSNVHGAVSINANVSNNKVFISGDTKLLGGAIRGGTSTSGNSFLNSVTITGIDIGSTLVTGGYSYSGNVYSNNLFLINISDNSNNEATGQVFAGHSITKGNVYNNIMTISGGTYGSDAKLYAASTDSGIATGNITYLLGGTTFTGSSVVGGDSGSGTVSGNSIKVIGKSQFNTALLIAGENFSGNVTQNTISIADGTFSDSIILAGRSETGTVSNNSLNITGGVYNSSDNLNYTRISAGQSRSSSSINNILSINSGIFGANTLVGGANTFTGVASSNTVNINGGTFESGSIIAGASSSSGKTSSNTVFLSENASLDGLVAGGYTESGMVSENRVIITSNIKGSGIISAGAASLNSAKIENNNIIIKSSTNINLGGVSLIGAYINDNTTGIATLLTNNSNVGSGNTLTLHTIVNNAGNVKNFDTYEFYVDSIGQKNYQLSAKTIDLGTDATVHVYLKNKGEVLNPGEEIELFSTPSNTTDIKGNIGNAKVYQGISLMTDLMINKDDPDSRALIVGATTANSLARTFPEARLISFSFVNQADDLMLGQGMANALEVSNKKPEKWQAFGAVDIGTSSYTTKDKNTGDISFTGMTMLTGFAKNQNLYDGKLLTGLYFEFGTGLINTENWNENLDSVKTGGTSNFYGLGLFSRYDFKNAFYIEGLIRLGILATDFTTEDAQNTLKYSANTNYYGLGISGGYQFEIQKNRDILDVYARYIWTHLEDKNMNIDSQEYHFDAINSQQLRTGAQYNFNHKKDFAPFLGLAIQYDFDGESTARIRKLYKTTSPELKGLTGILEAGLRFKPETIENLPLSVGMNVEAFIGRRRGVSVALDIAYTF